MLCELLPNSQIYFIDDGSSDQTLPTLVRFMESHKDYKIKLIVNDVNLGKAESLRRGLIEAMSDRDNEIIAFTDGDLATPPQEILRFLNHVLMVKRHAYLGVRAKNSDQVKTTHFRKVQGEIFNGLSKSLLRLDLKDPQCGMKAFRVSPSLRDVVNTPFVNEWLFDLEMLLRLKVTESSFSYKEISLDEWNHKRESKVKISDPIVMLLSLFRLRHTYLSKSYSE